MKSRPLPEFPSIHSARHDWWCLVDYMDVSTSDEESSVLHVQYGVAHDHRGDRIITTEDTNLYDCVTNGGDLWDRYNEMQMGKVDDFESFLWRYNDSQLTARLARLEERRRFKSLTRHIDFD